MNELFLNEYIIYIVAGLSIMIVLFIIWNIRLEIKVRRLLYGKDARSLEGSFISMQKDLDEFNIAGKNTDKKLTILEKRMATSLRGFSNVSFDAFKGMDSGGKSFATTFLNENGDGIIISNLQSRDRVSIFAKQVRNYKTDLELSEEEAESLTKAKESCNV